MLNRRQFSFDEAHFDSVEDQRQAHQVASRKAWIASQRGEDPDEVYAKSMGTDDDEHDYR